MSALKVARPVLKRPTTWAATVGAYLVYAVLAWLLVRLIGLSGASAWVLRIALWLVGAVAGGLVLWFLGGRSRREGGEAATGGADDIDVAIAAAEARLAEAGARGGVRSLPLIVVVLQSVGVPGEAIGVILGVDRLLDMSRTVLNVTGDLTAASVVDRSEARRYEVPVRVERREAGSASGS